MPEHSKSKWPSRLASKLAPILFPPASRDAPSGHHPCPSASAVEVHDNLQPGAAAGAAAAAAAGSSFRR